MSSNMITWKPSPPLTQNYLISHKTNIIRFLNTLPLISSNGHCWNNLTSINMHHNSSNLFPPWALKATLYFNFKNGVIPFDLPSVNIYQQTISRPHTNNSKHQVTIHQHLISQCTYIQNQTQKKIKHSQEFFMFTLSTMILFIHKQHQN